MAVKYSYLKTNIQGSNPCSSIDLDKFSEDGISILSYYIFTLR